MEVVFDIRGHLKPYGKITLTLEQFKDYFVDSFGFSKTRTNIFQNYLNYLADFQQEVTPNFVQWIDGSFVSKKVNPRDIDMVTLVDHQIVENKDSLLKQKFLNNSFNKSHDLDVYLLTLYPPNHERYSWTKSDLLYWKNWFTKSKMVRGKRRFPKGYIEIMFNE